MLQGVNDGLRDVGPLDAVALGDRREVRREEDSDDTLDFEQRRREW